MGTSLSGLTPATTFDGLLKVGDNDPLTADLKAISTGDGTDTILSLSTGALQIGGATGMYWDNTNKRLGIGTDAPSVPFEVYGAVRFRNNLNLNGNIFNSASGIVNIDGLAYFNGITDKVGIGESTPSARLHVKGSGNTDTTTALLVQNSAGSELFKLNDEGNINLGEAGASPVISAAKNSGKSLKLGNQAHLSSFDTIDFKTWDGTAAYTEVMRITGNTDQFVGIGETTPTARLHVKGSGATSATTSLLVENSSGTHLFKVRDDGSQYLFGNNTSIENDGSGFRLKAYGTTIFQAYGPYNQAYTPSGIPFGVGTGAGNSTGVMMQIKGSGNDATTTALLVQNSDGGDLLTLTDDGALQINSDATERFTIANANGNAALNFRYNNIYTSGGNVLYISGASTIISGGGSERLRTSPTGTTIKGSGTTSATTALLVENSAGTDLFKVDDSGASVFSGQTIFQNNVKLQGANDTSTLNNLRFVVPGSAKSLTINKDYSFANDASALVDIQSTTQGFLPPRMTDAERDAIATPAAGLMIYDTTNNQMNYWNGSTWIAF